ncbi:exo-beta-N-acetylmuramidase NamZ domain-containing protein [Ornithinibacillus sp. 179-J 7C1 HS]|uniref:exo-beta-N-acetylmuramidase NamZ family protein n=1 Tax=Ornithinibacillus sp. 179-J 7C1 HS TaxID=3142384 RepID=UPI0039A1EA55
MKLGLEVFLENHVDEFSGKRIGLLTNLTGVNHKLETTIDLFHQHKKLQLTALFGPEHGIRGEVQEGKLIESSIDPYTGIPIYSLYNKEKKPNVEMLKEVDVVFCDLQDIGARYYTFIYSLANTMQICGQEGKKVVVLDRPNPINGQSVEGNIVEKDFQSFVGKFPISVRHGMTIGELALLFKHEFGVDCELEVIPMDGWSREKYFDQTDLFWVSPSPNTTNMDMCVLYPGTCLVEGTNLSEGRGTTRPFEVIGAPFMDSRKLADKLNGLNMEGVRFRPAVFKPMYQKHAGEVCEGVQIHVADRINLQPFEMGILILETIYKLYPDKLEFILAGKLNRYFLDLLAGTDKLRKQIIKGDTTPFRAQLQDDINQFELIRKNYLLY